MALLFPTKKQWKRWSLPSKLTAIGTYVGILGIAITLLLFFLPSNAEDDFPEKEYTLSGIIRERGTTQAIEGVVVRIMDFPEVQPDTTDASGRFRIQFQTHKIQVEIEGTKEGYKTLRRDPMLAQTGAHNTYHMKPEP